MQLSDFTFLSLFIMFVLYIALKGNLQKYLQLIFYNPSDDTQKTQQGLQGQNRLGHLLGGQLPTILNFLTPHLPETP